VCAENSIHPDAGRICASDFASEHLIYLVQDRSAAWAEPTTLTETGLFSAESTINSFLSEVAPEVARLRPLAQLGALPDFGSRLMVELAIYTVAADRTLRDRDLDPASVRDGLADIGWSVYRRLLSLSSLPARLVTRDAGKRLRWSIRGLLIFPFRSIGAPGYAAEVFREGEDIHTHFTHCPPQSFARRIADETGDPKALAGDVAPNFYPA